MDATKKSKNSKKLNVKATICKTQSTSIAARIPALRKISSISKKNAEFPPNPTQVQTASSMMENQRDLTIIEKLPLFRLRTATIIGLVQYFSCESRSKLEKLSPEEKVTFAKETWQKIAEITNRQVAILRPLNASQAMTIYGIYKQAKSEFYLSKQFLIYSNYKQLLAVIVSPVCIFNNIFAQKYRQILP
jgi:hypothetical protein